MMIWMKVVPRYPPQLFFNEMTAFKTSPRWYLLKYVVDQYMQ